MIVLNGRDLGALVKEDRINGGRRPKNSRRPQPTQRQQMRREGWL